jgi:hypothetical protein
MQFDRWSALVVGEAIRDRVPSASLKLVRREVVSLDLFVLDLIASFLIPSSASFLPAEPCGMLSGVAPVHERRGRGTDNPLIHWLKQLRGDASAIIAHVLNIRSVTATRPKRRIIWHRYGAGIRKVTSCLWKLRLVFRQAAALRVIRTLPPSRW